MIVNEDANPDIEAALRFFTDSAESIDNMPGAEVIRNRMLNEIADLQAEQRAHDAAFGGSPGDPARSLWRLQRRRFRRSVVMGVAVLTMTSSIAVAGNTDTRVGHVVRKVAHELNLVPAPPPQTKQPGPNESNGGNGRNSGAANSGNHGEVPIEVFSGHIDKIKTHAALGVHQHIDPVLVANGQPGIDVEEAWDVDLPDAMVGDGPNQDKPFDGNRPEGSHDKPGGGNQSHGGSGRPDDDHGDRPGGSGERPGREDEHHEDDDKPGGNGRPNGNGRPGGGEKPDREERPGGEDKPDREERPDGEDKPPIGGGPGPVHGGEGSSSGEGSGTGTRPGEDHEQEPIEKPEDEHEEDHQEEHEDEHEDEPR